MKKVLLISIAIILSLSLASFRVGLASTEQTQPSNRPLLEFRQGGQKNLSFGVRPRQERIDHRRYYAQRLQLIVVDAQGKPTWETP